MTYATIGFAFFAAFLAWFAASFVFNIEENLYQAVKFTLWAGFFGFFAVYFYGSSWAFYLDLGMFVFEIVGATYFWHQVYEIYTESPTPVTVKEGTEGAWNYHIAKKDSTRSLCGELVMPCALNMDDWNESYTTTVETVYCEECDEVFD